MAKLDFWWDTGEPRQSTNFDTLLKDVLARRPAIETPTLAVIGSFRRFQGSCLHKVAERTALFRAIDFNALSNAEIASPLTRLLKWSPFAGHEISGPHRARIPAGVRVLNDTALDTRKRHVEEVFAAVAGYDIRLDPRGDGLAVVKSEGNGTHDGRIVRLPIADPDPGKVCERVVDNTVGEHFVFDLRVAFVSGSPVLAYVKFRERSRRFDNSNTCVKVVAPSDVLTDEEIFVCQRFCATIGLDYGEIDILRDGPRGRIYAIDVNNTPAGPPKGLSFFDQAVAMRMIAVGLRQHAFGLPC